MPIMQEGRGKRMPFLFLSPSTQYFNPYVTTGDERYWMNALADEMMPYLHASGITVTRNDPGSCAASISTIIRRARPGCAWRISLWTT